MHNLNIPTCLPPPISMSYSYLHLIVSRLNRTNQREDFLAYSLGDGYYQNCTCVERSLSFPYPDGLGIKKERINKFQKLNVPENFTTNLYAWVKARFNMEQEELRQLILERNVCLTDEKCIDLNDIGALCCPF
ncbi:hypothetical protein HCN44_001635 [Aphidius gifuensis]|uniref:Uncharacterized protein n=1 Tax=Aphidius gifuensis TaxID=684658 RepID=A0A834XRU3_APHGI|nr:hypothetical protein HCN44_001635 [Aphidius gifuensis]